MRTYNLYYQDRDSFKAFVDRLNIKNSDSILIQIFTSESNYDFIKSLQRQVTQIVPQSILIGATTDGEISSGLITVDTTVISISIFENTYLESTLIEHSLNSKKSAKEIERRLLRDDTKLIILFTDGLTTNGEEFLSGFSKTTPIAGGMAGDRRVFKESFVFDRDRVINSGVAAVALNSDTLKIHRDYNFNWQPIGKKMVVTKSKANRLYQINGVDAIDIYRKYLCRDISENLVYIGVEFPLIINRDGIDIARAVIGFGDDNSLIFAGNIKEGEEIRFGIGNVSLMLNRSYQIAKSLDDKEIESIFIYSCMARRALMANSIESEVFPFQKFAPTSGFFTYGEFFYLDSDRGSELFNEAMTIVTLSEGAKEIKSLILNNIEAHQTFTRYNHTKVLSNLINEVTRELEDINLHLEEKVKEKTDSLVKQAYIDKLTRFPNRLKLIEDLKKCNRQSLILLNIDHFKLINDFYGENIGDYLLVEVGATIKRALRERDAKVYKLQGDEFAILYDRVFPKVKFERVVKHLSEHLSKLTIEYKNHEIHIDITIGSAQDKRRLLTKADMVLKRAKIKRKHYLIYDDSMKISREFGNNLKWSKRIKEALRERRFVPFFQPIVNNKTQKIEKYESLVRMLTPDRDGVITPIHFLDIAKQIRLYPEITQSMIESSFKFFDSKREYEFSINLSIDDILESKTVQFIKEELKNYNIADRVVFEVTESEEIGNYKDIIKFIRDVKDLGCKIAIDDFGSGYSNFIYLTKIEADYIKIDGTLIKNLDRDRNSQIITKTIVDFSKELNIKTIAEYIHSKDIFQKQKSLGIDYAQGYFLGEPTSRENLIKKIGG